MNRQYRSLTESEIKELESAGCACLDWNRVEIDVRNTSIRSIRNTEFDGDVKIGLVGAKRDVDSVYYTSGIYNAHVIDSVIGDNVIIRNVCGALRGYDVSDDATIINVGNIVCSDKPTFGIGETIDVVNENGGRGIPLCIDLSSQISYLLAFYKYKQAFYSNLSNLLVGRSEKELGTRGKIGKGSKIIGVKSIINVWIGDNAHIANSSKLENGVILSSIDERTVVTNDVIAESFIFAYGSKITDGAFIERCYVGECSMVGEGFTAKHCVISSMCQLFCGEACSVFAGPFTVSHHKSTLLIAGMFSFMNAGSATNQSNHYYRLGPNHEGVLGRGSKTASGSYLLWPAISGAFTLVKGKHSGNLDTRLFPYSYLIEQNGETWIYPAISIKSAGTDRDIKKWKKRDERISDTSKRSVQVLRDIINYDVNSPFILAQVFAGIDKLKQLQKHTPKHDANYHKYGRAKIHTVAVDAGLELYEMYLKRALHDIDDANEAEIDPCDKWADVAGEYMSIAQLKNLIDCISQGVADIHEVQMMLSDIEKSYETNKKAWFVSKLKAEGLDIASMKAESAKTIALLESMVQSDREKEYSDFMQVGYGMDLDERLDDFESVQGR